MKYATKAFYWLLFFFLLLYLGISTISLRIIAQHAINQEYDQALATQKSAAILFAAKIEDQEPTKEQLRNLSDIVKSTVKNDFEILDKEGKSVYASTTDFPSITEVVNYDSIKKNTINISPIITIKQEKFLFTSSTIGTTDYYLVSKQNLITYQSILKKASHYFRMILFLLQIVLIPMSWFLSTLITKPIQKLIDRATEIAKGQTTKPFVVEKRGDEVEKLANSLNDMANKLNQDIEQISQEKEKQELFVSSLSHEISTPLTSIIGYAQMLQWEDLKEPSSEFVDYILEESFRLKSLSEDVLRLLYSKKNEMNLEAISTDQIDSYITQFVSGLDERILLQMTLQKATIRMDFNLFKLVIANIFSNALDAMKDRKEMCITGYSNEGRYYFILKDTGQGIPEEIIDQVTDEFFTGDVTRNSGHLGLGLSLVKNIISLHEGQVTITSEKGEGTFITIDFPLDED